MSVIRVAYNTLGCKVNQYETERIRAELERAGLQTVPFSSVADAYIINTCSVTSVADGKSRASVRKALRLNPNAFVVVSGCYSELEPDEIGSIEGVDLIVPNTEKETIPERILAHLGSPASETQHPTPKPRVRTRAVVKVQDGCDQFCSYCVIPFARSGKRSRELASVIKELESLAQFGYKEVVLAGIRLGSYNSGDARLPKLVRAASEVQGIERIRLSSIEPWEVDDALLDAMGASGVCRHLHIPLQSGDDGVLSQMNRPYDSAQYLRIIERVRNRIPGIGITTDVIVGFPGESDIAFENTCAVVKSAGFSRLHVFRYSTRPRTRAASMPQQVSPDIKKARAEKLINLGIIAMRHFAQSLIGETVDVLVESEDKASGSVRGFADNYVEINLPGDSCLKGKIAQIRINEVDQEGRVIGIRC